MREKLNLLRLSKPEIKTLMAGREPGDCCCACAYANAGGSDTADNANANIDQGLWSPHAPCK
jgi:hypothetical protein